MVCFASSFADLGFWPYVLFGVVACVGLVVIVFGGRRADLERRQRFHDRADLSIVDFVQACHTSRPIDFERASELLDCVAESLGISRGKLRPTDRIDVELAPVSGWELDDGVTLRIDLYMKRWQQRTGKELPSGLATIGDLVAACCGVE